MKKFLIPAVAIILICATPSSAAERVAASEAKDYIGKNVVVTGKVAEVHISEKVVRINFDRTFPNQSFTAVVFSNRTNQFPALQALNGKQVEVSGVVSEYRSRPEIIVNRTNQLQVISGEKK